MTHSTDSPRFLIVRLSAVGDTIFSLPVACALRRKFPRAFIGWVVEPLSATILRGHECLDEVVVVPRGWWKSPRTVLQLRHKLRTLEIDTTIDVQSLSKSALVARLSGARQRIGFAPPWGRELSLAMNNVRVRAKADHVVEAFLELLAPLGISQPRPEFRITDDVAARTSMAAFVDGELPAQAMAVINPAASWNSKLWPAARYGQVAQHLNRRHGMRSVVLWYGAAERALAEEIVAGSAGHALLAPPTKLNEVAALARRAKLFLSSDTGPLHLSAAVGTPSVGLYGTSRVERCGPYGPHCLGVQAYYQAGTSRQRRSAENTAMQAIGVEQVCQACDEVLQRASSAAKEAKAA